MKTIKFSHKYSKLPEEPEVALLIQAIEYDFKDLSPSFRQYDTEYREGAYSKNFPLSKYGKCLILVFRAWPCGKVFTTIRSAYPPSKIQYYYDSIGHVFEIKLASDSVK